MAIGKRWTVRALGIPLLLVAGGLHAQETPGRMNCRSATLAFSLKGDEGFEKRMAFVSFKMQPLKFTGWMFTLQDSKGRDYFYPVNPPLRLNPSQTLGKGYGMTARESLRGGRELRFLLSEADYDAIEPLATDALWPYNASDPDRALDRYTAKLNSLSTGLFRLAIVSSDISQEDKINSAEFKIEFIAPADFPFDPSVTLRPVDCPTGTRPQAKPAR